MMILQHVSCSVRPHCPGNLVGDAATFPGAQSRTKGDIEPMPGGWHLDSLLILTNEINDLSDGLIATEVVPGEGTATAPVSSFRTPVFAQCRPALSASSQVACKPRCHQGPWQDRAGTMIRCCVERRLSGSKPSQDQTEPQTQSPPEALRSQRKP